MNKKLTLSQCFFTLLFISVVIISSLFRAIFKGSIQYVITFIPYILYLWLIIKKISKDKKYKNSQIFEIFTSLILFMGYIVSMYISRNVNVSMIISVGIPMLFIFIKLNKEETYNSLMIFKNGFAIIILFIFIFGVLDLLTGYKFSNLFAGIYNTEAIFNMREEEPYRIISILGHPLYTSLVGLISMVFFYTHYRVCKNSFKNMLFLQMIAICIIALSGSKTAITLGLIYLAYILIENKYFTAIVLSIILIVVIYYSGIFDGIIKRFTDSFLSGDLTTGRNVYLKELISSGELKFNLIFGYNGEMSERMIIALEYPILRMAYRYGILYSAIWTIGIFVYPMIKILKQKNYFLAFSFLLIMINVNVYSGMCSQGNTMITYCSVVIILLNLSENIVHINERCSK